MINVWRIELASSPDSAPLYLAADGERTAWVPEAAEALGFRSDFAAWDYVAANVQSLCRVRATALSDVAAPNRQP
ncbi:hypothetical protein [Methylobacterium sp. A54F]